MRVVQGVCVAALAVLAAGCSGDGGGVIEGSGTIEGTDVNVGAEVSGKILEAWHRSNRPISSPSKDRGRKM
jgi:hypothetical protein